MTRRSFPLFALPFLAWIASGADQWTQFRGPNGSGVDSSPGYPAEFSPSKNVVWKKAIPYGQSSPVVVGARVYLTASEGDRLLTILIDAKTGAELWRREIRRERPHKIFHANDQAYFDRVSFWTTPRKDCGDGRGATCKDYSDWVQAWTDIKG